MSGLIRDEFCTWHVPGICLCAVHVIVCNHFIPFSRGRGGCSWSQSQLSLGEGRVHPGQVTSSSQGPHRWQPHIRSNLGFSTLVKNTSTCSSVQQVWLATFRSLADLLYPLSSMCCSYKYKIFFKDPAVVALCNIK